MEKNCFARLLGEGTLGSCDAFIFPELILLALITAGFFDHFSDCVCCNSLGLKCRSHCVEHAANPLQFEIEITCQTLYAFDFTGVSMLLLILSDWSFKNVLFHILLSTLFKMDPLCCLNLRDRTNPHNLFKMDLSGLHSITENLHLDYPNPGLNHETGGTHGSETRGCDQ